jgi:4-hydroxybenzoate polyprenyltransferase
LGVCAGFYLTHTVGKSGFAAIFILISALLYLYATYLKGILIVGNLVVSILVAFSILIVGIFDLIPTMQADELDLKMRLFKIILHYAIFALLLNFIRELVKDLQDVNGDKNGGMNTLPIAIGRKRATFVTFLLGVLMIFVVVAYMYIYLYSNQSIVLYFLFLIVAPLFYFCTKAWTANSKKEYAFLSVLLKVIMLLGMGSILLYKFVIQ